MGPGDTSGATPTVGVRKYGAKIVIFPGESSNSGTPFQIWIFTLSEHTFEYKQEMFSLLSE